MHELSTSSSGRRNAHRFRTDIETWLSADLCPGRLGAKSILGESARSGVEISGIETIALEDSNYGFTLMRVHTNNAINGLGQAESPSPVIDSTIKTRGGLENLLVGEDPLQVERLWQKMYAATGLWGRRGVTIAAIGAVETALWDIAGKIVNKPVSELIWRSFATVKETAEIKTYVVPYATVYPPGNTKRKFASASPWAFSAASVP